jgi:hypothetical protein
MKNYKLYKKDERYKMFDHQTEALNQLTTYDIAKAIENKTKECYNFSIESEISVHEPFWYFASLHELSNFFK